MIPAFHTWPQFAYEYCLDVNRIENNYSLLAEGAAGLETVLEVRQKISFAMLPYNKAHIHLNGECLLHQIRFYLVTLHDD